MKSYDYIIIGFGKAGKTLAGRLSSDGKNVAIIEENPKMYGGTCINIGCIPTKVLIQAAKSGDDFNQAMSKKENVTQKLRQKNHDMLANKQEVDLYTARAEFISDKIIKISSTNESEELTAEYIIINTGAVSNILPIPGLKESQFTYDSTGIQNLKEQPKRLGIIGGGNIGLEFANLYATLGSSVTVFDSVDRLFAREEEEVSDLAQHYLEEQGITFELASQIKSVQDNKDTVILTTDKGEFTFDALLYATGRKANTEKLGLENTNIKQDARGAILVNEFCETSVPGIFAVGDVNGGPQFTYISLDDYRIVYHYLNGNTQYSHKNRTFFPSTTFINPPLSRVGIDEKTAKEQNIDYKANRLDVAGMPRAHVNNDLRGFFKVVVDAKTHQILGATLFGAQSEELINLIVMAMDNNIPYTYFQSQIFTHPTMAENFNDLFNF